MVWTEEKLQTLFRVGKGCVNLEQISDEFYKAEGIRLSPSAIRSAVSRYTDYNITDIKNGVELLALPDDGIAKPQEEALSQDLINQMKVMYADKSCGGYGMTAFDVAVTLQDRTSITLTADLVRRVLKEEGQTKKIIPDVIQDNLDMVVEERESLKRKVLQSQSYQKTYIKSLEKRIDQLESYEHLRQLASGEPTSYKKITVPQLLPSSLRSVLVCPVSDVHSGAVWSALKDNKYYQRKQIEYNSSVLEQRQDRLQYAWTRMFHSSGGGFGEVHYLSLGDDLEGLYANLRNGQFLDQDSFEYKQLVRVKKFHIENILFLIMLNQLNDKKRKIRVTFTPGNHDRLYQDKSYNSENFIACLLADMVSNDYELRCKIKEYGEDLVDIDTAIPMVSYLYEQLGVGLIAHHGHLFNINNDKDIVNLAHIHGVPDAKRYVMIQGHLHHFKAQQTANCKYIFNPSYCGNTGYSSIQIQKSAPPQAIGILIQEREDLILGPYELS